MSQFLQTILQSLHFGIELANVGADGQKRAHTQTDANINSLLNIYIGMKMS